jgi:MraZ protein
MAFLGEYQHNMDPKNRVFIPAKFRETLGECFVVFKAPDETCLFLYTNEEWERVVAEVYDLPPSKLARQVQRRLFHGAATVEADKSGRITLPAAFCDYAKLEKECVISGNGRRVEIWDSKLWQDALDADEAADEAYKTIEVRF